MAGVRLSTSRRECSDLPHRRSPISGQTALVRSRASVISVWRPTAVGRSGADRGISRASSPSPVRSVPNVAVPATTYPLHGLAAATSCPRHVTVVEVSGEIDLLTAPELADRLSRCLAGEMPLVVVDLRRVIDLDGLTVRCEAQTRVHVDHHSYQPQPQCNQNNHVLGGTMSHPRHLLRRSRPGCRAAPRSLWVAVATLGDE